MTNLIYKHGREKHFQIILYPDGQQNVELDMEYFNNVKEPINIYCSIRSFRELEVLLCLVAALRKNDFHIKTIYLNYIIGMRSDRAFKIGQPNYFRGVMAPLLNSLNVQLKVLSPHSKLSFSTLYNATAAHIHWEFENNCHIIGADESACWSTFIEVPHFTKKRTDNGLTVNLEKRFYSDIEDLPEHTPLLIKDDLCDGGATFISIADYLNNHFPDRKKFLLVTHGLFTKGVEHVACHYDKVITTNSYKEFESHPKLTVIDVWN